MSWSHQDDINRTDAVRVELNASVVLTYMCNYTAEENVRDDLMYSEVVFTGKYAAEVWIRASECSEVFHYLSTLIILHEILIRNIL